MTATSVRRATRRRQAAVSGADPVSCPALDQCQGAGECDPTTGGCQEYRALEGSRCDDGNACTQTDRCVAGSCAGANPVQCVALDQCHKRGTCDPVTGAYSGPARVDGTPCDDGDACGGGDLCLGGSCVGYPLPDSDGDGFCDLVDLCPWISDPAQLDTDGDGIGDVCQCTASAPGRCIGGGGSARRDCLLELATTGPVSFNRQRTNVKRVLRCGDGDAGCDLDGARDGQCTFGIALCFANADPRYPRCTPSMIRRTEILLPRAGRSAPSGALANVKQFEQALSALGLEVRRQGQVIAERTAPIGNDVCTPLLRLVTAAPKASGGGPVRQKLLLRVLAENGRRDKDHFALVCE